MNAPFSAIVKKEIWTQTVEDANNAVQLLKRLEDSGYLTSCNGILDFKPAYSSFKIRKLCAVICNGAQEIICNAVSYLPGMDNSKIYFKISYLTKQVFLMS